MQSDSIELALRQVCETKHLVEGLLVSSESFDYVRAKAVLEQLKIKVKILGKIESDLETQRRPLSEVIVRFPRFDQREG
jgi:hypothetical protein